MRRKKMYTNRSLNEDSFPLPLIFLDKKYLESKLKCVTQKKWCMVNWFCPEVNSKSTMCIIVSLKKCRLWVTFKSSQRKPMPELFLRSNGYLEGRGILFSVFEIPLHLRLLREQRCRLKVYSRCFPANWSLIATLQSQFCVRWKGRHSLSMTHFNSEMELGSAGGHCA